MSAALVGNEVRWSEERGAVVPGRAVAKSRHMIKAGKFGAGSSRKGAALSDLDTRRTGSLRA